MSYPERTMDATQYIEVGRSLQNRRQDHVLNDPSTAALREFIEGSTARLQAQTITPEEHNTEVAMLAVQQREADPFTGMFNKEGFKRELEIAIDVAQEFQLPLVVLFIDGDRFGEINKNSALGYAVGDRIIRAVGHAIGKAARRASDIKAHIEEGDETEEASGSAFSTEARPGGDEFALILLGTDVAGAEIVANRIRDGVTSLVDTEVPEYRSHYGKPLTVSIGSAEFDPNLDDAKTLLTKADLSLQTEKRLKKFGSIPMPDLSNATETETWIQTWVKTPPNTADSSIHPDQQLATERHSLIQFARYANNNPEARPDVLNLLVKAVTREAS